MLPNIKMRSKLWVWVLIMLGVVPTALLLWQSSQAIDGKIADKFQDAEAERHAFVISSNFDLLKENLIEVHRDYWLLRVGIAEQARWTTGLLAGNLLLLILLIVKLWRRPSPSSEKQDPPEEPS